MDIPKHKIYLFMLLFVLEITFGRYIWFWSASSRICILRLESKHFIKPDKPTEKAIIRNDFPMFTMLIVLSCQSTLTGGLFSKIFNNHRRQVNYGRFATRLTKSIIRTIRRTIPERETFNQSVEEQCKLISKYCQKSYNTGRLCGRSVLYIYNTFENYCMLDYVNCVERYEMWQIAHMGQCYTLKNITDYHHVEYLNDSFLDRDTVADDHHWDF